MRTPKHARAALTGPLAPVAAAAAAHEPTTIEVVASGLNAPRGLVYDADDQRVLVAEAGSVAGDLVPGNPCGLAERQLPFCLGLTGAIYQYAHGSGGGSSSPGCRRPRSTF